ncbi:hypothetical protein AB1Y20_017794 [Prymnesium parvum]|uniref:Cation/H+ exchanger transmembrane domain-containing protein n=1 Tax=Prymnesium parvum TaxID=97485 RepID=A0AB34JL88_PRYPA
MREATGKMLTVCYNVTAGNETENAACRDEDVERHEDPIKFLLFPMSALFVSVLTQMICSKFQINVPVTVVLFIYGLLLGLIADQTPNFALGEATMSWTNANPHLYFYTVLPLLVFNDSLHLPMHTFFKIFNSATLLATVGVAIGTITIAVLSYYALPVPEALKLTFYEAMTLGAITSATDPVAALAVLKSSGASVRLSTLVAGESLMNDGTALVLFRIFWGLAEGCHEYSVQKGIAVCMKLSLGGVLCGTIVGLVTYTLIAICQFCPLESVHIANAQVILSLICAYSAFAFAESYFEVSGIISTLSAGVVINFLWRRLSTYNIHSTLWEFLEWAGNTILFTLAGAVIATVDVYAHEKGLSPLSRHSDDGTKMTTEAKALLDEAGTGMLTLSGILVMLYAMFARALTLALLWPLLRRTSPWLDAKDGLTLWWSGLRGAVGLLIAIIVVHTPTVEAAKAARQMCIFIYVATLTIGTMAIMAPTIGWLLHKLRKLDKTIDAKQQLDFVRAVLLYRSFLAEPSFKQRARFSNIDNKLLKRLIDTRSRALLRPLSVAMEAIIHVASEKLKLSTSSAPRSLSSARLTAGEPSIKNNEWELSSGSQVEQAHDLMLVWMRRIFLQMLAVRINVHLDLISTADNFTPIAKLDQVVNEELDETDSPLNLWSRLAPHMKWHRRFVNCEKLIKRTAWRQQKDAEEPHLFKAEINTMVTLICVMEEAWDELHEAVATEITHGEEECGQNTEPSENTRGSITSFNRTKSLLQVPVEKLRKEVDAQLTHAHQTLQHVPAEQLRAATTMKLAQMILNNRRKLLEEMNSSGLWPESEQVSEHHHIAHQLSKATDLGIIPKPRELQPSTDDRRLQTIGQEI